MANYVFLGVLLATFGVSGMLYCSSRQNWPSFICFALIYWAGLSVGWSF